MDKLYVRLRPNIHVSSFPVAAIISNDAAEPLPASDGFYFYLVNFSGFFF